VQQIALQVLAKMVSTQSLVRFVPVLTITLPLLRHAGPPENGSSGAVRRSDSCGLVPAPFCPHEHFVGTEANQGNEEGQTLLYFAFCILHLSFPPSHFSLQPSAFGLPPPGFGSKAGIGVRRSLTLDWAMARWGRQKGLCIWQFAVSRRTEGNLKYLYEHATYAFIGAQSGRQVARGIRTRPRRCSTAGNEGNIFRPEGGNSLKTGARCHYGGCCAAP